MFHLLTLKPDDEVILYIIAVLENVVNYLFFIKNKNLTNWLWKVGWKACFINVVCERFCKWQWIKKLLHLWITPYVFSRKWRNVKVIVSHIYYTTIFQFFIKHFGNKLKKNWDWQFCNMSYFKRFDWSNYMLSWNIKDFLLSWRFVS